MPFKKTLWLNLIRDFLLTIAQVNDAVCELTRSFPFLFSPFALLLSYLERALVAFSPVSKETTKKDI